MMVEVIVLFEGYSSRQDKNGNCLANCTCTLIKGPPHIIVDTMTPWDGDNISEALLKNKINCNDINYVICTHGHSDHTGCNYLFRNATHIVGHCISHKNKYFSHDFRSGKEYIINDNVKIIPVPGHTMQDICVILKDNNNKIVAITGDLFEKEEDLIDEKIWMDAGSDCVELQKTNRKNILTIADIIIPGHGPMFHIKK